MARICSFEIQYRNQSFPTLISVLNNENDVVCTVHFVQRRLRFLEPGDKLVYNRQQGLQQPNNLPQDLSDELNRCIVESVLGQRTGRA